MTMFLLSNFFFILVTNTVFVNRTTYQHSFMVDFRQIQDLDVEFKNNLQKLFQKLCKTTKRAIYSRPSGSAIEASSGAGFFRRRKNHDVFYEVDVEQQVVEITEEYKHCIEDNKTKSGFLTLNNSCLVNCEMCAITCKHYGDYKAWLNATACKDGLFCHNNIKSFYDRKKLDAYYIELIMRVLYAGDIANGFRVSVSEERTKSSYIRNYVFDFWRKKHQFQVEQAFTIKLQWQTNITAQWLKRNRNWPQHHQIEDEMNTGYIIAKVSPEEKANKESTELRYSFGHLERTLTHLRSDHQNLVYLIFKSMFYRWLHPIDPDHITSYIAKTVMLWVCEKYPPEHEIWNEDTNSTINALQLLFQSLRDAFKKSYLSYYFIPEINVIGHIPRLFTREAISITSNILEKVQRFIPRTRQTKEVFEMSRVRLYLLKRFTDSMQEMVSEDCTVIDLLLDKII